MLRKTCCYCGRKLKKEERDDGCCNENHDGTPCDIRYKQLGSPEERDDDDDEEITAVVDGKPIYGRSALASAQGEIGLRDKDVFYRGNDVAASDDGSLAIKKGDHFFKVEGGKLKKVATQTESVTILIPVEASSLKKGDVILDPESKMPVCFVSSSGDDTIKIKDVAGNQNVDRDLVASDLTGTVMVDKLVSVNFLYRNNPALVALARQYGAIKTAQVLAYQMAATGAVDAKKIEFELNPVAATLEISNTLNLIAQGLASKKSE